MRPAPAHMLLAAGLVPAAIVGVGGLSLGFFAWYVGVSHSIRLLGLSELFLLLAIPLGVAAAFAGWIGYSRYFSERTGIDRRTALRFDCACWGMLAVLWIAILAPTIVLTAGKILALALALFFGLKLLIAARFNQTVREVTTTFFVTRIPIIIIAELAAVLIGQRPGEHTACSTQAWLAVWCRWDAIHYLDIAQYGYHGTDMAFFPLYPTLIAILGRLIGNYLIAGLIISNVALFFGLLFCYKLVQHQYDRQVAYRAIFYISIFPTAIFFSAVYTEAPFFALTVASFYYIREHKWLLAGMIGCLAAMARVEGVLLVAPFAIEWWLTARHDRKLRLPAIGGIALICAGLGFYMAYLWMLRGDPLYFSHVQVNWHRHLAPPWVALWNSIALMRHSHTPITIANQLIELTFTLLMLSLLIAGWKTLRLAYWVYMALSVIVPMSTSSLMSMPRFALVLFPMFTLLALWGKRPAINNAIVAFALPLLGLFTVLFADWYWVA